MSTIKTVAERAGVSLKTVSRVFSSPEAVADKTRALVMAAAEDLQFVPDQRARAIRSGKSGVVGLLTDVVATTPCSIEIVRGVEAALEERRMSLLIGNLENPLSTSKSIIRSFRAGRVDGVIYAANYHREVADFEPLSLSGVMVNCFTRAGELPAVIPDEERGGYNVGVHLLSLGHRRIAYLTLAPDIPVLSEESKSIAWETRRAWPRYWLVDPLDGTREFVKRNGEFTVNIALIENHAPLLGVVLLPVTGDLYYGVAGEGAFLESAPGALPRPIATRAAAAVPVVAGSRSHGSDRQGEVLARLGDHRLVSVGSSIKFCMVARGDADLYLRLGPTSEWDTAAAQCVVEQAGGAVVNLHGEPLRYNTGDSLLNPEFLAIGDTSVDWLARLRPA